MRQRGLIFGKRLMRMVVVSQVSKRESSASSGPAHHPTDEDLSAGTPAHHPTDEDLSAGTPAIHPTDEDLSAGTPALHPTFSTRQIWATHYKRAPDRWDI